MTTQARSETRSSGIDVHSIPPYVKENLAATLLKAIRAWYSVPENMEKYEAWLAQRNANEVNT